MVPALLFCSHFLFLHLCFFFFSFMSTSSYCQCFRSCFSLLSPISWCLFWSVWGCRLVRNVILKVIACMAKWLCTIKQLTVCLMWLKMIQSSNDPASAFPASVIDPWSVSLMSHCCGVRLEWSGTNKLSNYLTNWLLFQCSLSYQIYNLKVQKHK